MEVATPDERGVDRNAAGVHLVGEAAVAVFGGTVARAAEDEAYAPVAEVEEVRGQAPCRRVIVDTDRRGVGRLFAGRNLDHRDPGVAQRVADQTVITQRWQQDHAIEAQLTQERSHVAIELRAVAVPRLHHQVVARVAADFRRARLEVA